MLQVKSFPTQTMKFGPSSHGVRRSALSSFVRQVVTCGSDTGGTSPLEKTVFFRLIGYIVLFMVVVFLWSSLSSTPQLQQDVHQPLDQQESQQTQQQQQQQQQQIAEPPNTHSIQTQDHGSLLWQHESKQQPRGADIDDAELFRTFRHPVSRLSRASTREGSSRTRGPQAWLSQVQISGLESLKREHLEATDPRKSLPHGVPGTRGTKVNIGATEIGGTDKEVVTEEKQQQEKQQDHQEQEQQGQKDLKKDTSTIHCDGSGALAKPWNCASFVVLSPDKEKRHFVNNFAEFHPECKHAASGVAMFNTSTLRASYEELRPKLLKNALEIAANIGTVYGDNKKTTTLSASVYDGAAGVALLFRLLGKLPLQGNALGIDTQTLRNIASDHARKAVERLDRKETQWDDLQTARLKGIDTVSKMGLFQNGNQDELKLLTKTSRDMVEDAQGWVVGKIGSGAANGFTRSGRECPSLTCGGAMLGGDAGVWAVCAVTAYENDEAELAKTCATRLRDLVLEDLSKVNDDADHEYNGLMFGRAGRLFVMLWANRHYGGEALFTHEEIGEVWDLIVKYGQITAANVRQLKRDVATRAAASGDTTVTAKDDVDATVMADPGPMAFEWRGRPNLGAAHGLGGVLHVLLSLPVDMLTSKMKALETIVLPSLDYLISKTLSSGNLPFAADSKSDLLVQWCDGAPGVVSMLARASHLFEEPKYMDIAKEMGEVVWKRGLLRKGSGLCHGMAGNAYSLLALHRYSGEEKWLARVLDFVRFIRSDVGKECTGMPTVKGAGLGYSLYLGQPGVAYLFADLLDIGRARFPAFEDVY